MSEYTREEILANRKRWLDALRAGNVKQAQNQLATIVGDGEVRYCCLGVACEVLGIKSEVREDMGLVAYGDEPQSLELPNEAAQALGFTRANPRLRMPSPDDEDRIEVLALATLNDAFGYSFEQIADAIELFRFVDEDVVEGLQ